MEAGMSGIEQYFSLIDSKKILHAPSGFEYSYPIDHLFPFQAMIVRWSIKKGKSAIFADTGLGKTAMQITWADIISKRTERDILILAPLCVAHQTVREGIRFGIDIHYCRSMDEVRKGITITNYEMMDKFDFHHFGGIVLDESSILKSYTGSFRNRIIDLSASIPYRLSCTATPSPNDYMELGNQAEFLGIMSRVEMLAMFFTHDGGETSKWRLKGHAKKKFWEWMATWCVCVRKPSDIGFDDDGYNLPGINFIHHVIPSKPLSGKLFAEPVHGLLEQGKARRESLELRMEMAKSIVKETESSTIVWCNLNDESDYLERIIDEGKAVSGSDSIEKKENIIEEFLSGDLKVIISKTSIMGFGLNLQHCHNMVFSGITNSFEDFYQAIRRCFRFGQKEIVNVHLIYSELEIEIAENLKRKESQHEEMSIRMIDHMKDFMKKEFFKTSGEKMEYKRDVKTGKGFELHLADCVEMTSELEEGSIDYTIFSPPFSSLYTYSNSDFDMGNVKDDEEFFKQFSFLVRELFRVTRPGRLLSFHCMNLPTSKERDGVIGIRDFRGDLIRMFCSDGFIYHSEVVIWKDPVTAMQRTKALGLLYKTIKKDASMSRQGIPDYLVTMRKPGINTKPVSHDPEEFPCDLWQKYASPVWMDINPSKTLNKGGSRDQDDERHICPLQLEVIERAIELWTVPGDLVLSPFAGIGSEGYVAIQKGRRFIGSELKPSYWNIAIDNLTAASVPKSGPGVLFSMEDSSSCCEPIEQEIP